MPECVRTRARATRVNSHSIVFFPTCLHDVFRRKTFYRVSTWGLGTRKNLGTNMRTVGESINHQLDYFGENLIISDRLAYILLLKFLRVPHPLFLYFDSYSNVILR